MNEARAARGALFCLWRVPRWQRLSVPLTLVVTLAVIDLGGFIAFVGGKN